MRSAVRPKRYARRADGLWVSARGLDEGAHHAVFLTQQRIHDVQGLNLRVSCGGRTLNRVADGSWAIVVNFCSISYSSISCGLRSAARGLRKPCERCDRPQLVVV